MNDDRYDPLQPDQTADPYPTLAGLRARQAVHHSPDNDLWVVGRYDDVVAAARDPEHFSSRTSTSGHTNPMCPEAAAILAQTWSGADTLVSTDPPEHTLNRRLLNAAFSIRRVTALEPFVRSVAEELFDAFASEGRVDIVTGLAYPLPMTVIAHVLGFPRAEIATLKRWSDDIAEGLSADLSVEDQVRVATSVAEFRGYVAAAIEERRAAPRDDFLSDLANGNPDDGRRLTFPELLSLCEQVFVAGNETTTSLITTMAWLLLGHSATMEAVRAEPNLVPLVVEESLRLQAPVQGRYRVTTADVDVGGCRIPAGSRVQLHLGSANRDPSMFPSPDRFDLSRPNHRSHLAFGSGPHFCVGAPLSRLEARVAIENLVTRLPGLRLPADQELRWHRHFHLRGLESLRVEWDV